jgi:uncharacterized protein
MRISLNMPEYAPFTLLLMGLAESLQASQATLYAAGGCLVAGRLLHALGVSQANEIIVIRTAGITLTISAIIIAALACIRLGLAVHT